MGANVYAWFIHRLTADVMRRTGPEAAPAQCTIVDCGRRRECNASDDSGKVRSRYHTAAFTLGPTGCCCLAVVCALRLFAGCHLLDKLSPSNDWLAGWAPRIRPSYRRCRQPSGETRCSSRNHLLLSNYSSYVAATTYGLRPTVLRRLWSHWTRLSSWRWDEMTNCRFFIILAASAESVLQRSGVPPSVRLSAVPSEYSSWLTRGSMRRCQRTFRSDNKENRRTCFHVGRSIAH